MSGNTQSGGAARPAGAAGAAALRDSEELAALRLIVEKTAAGTGEEYFRAVVRQLAEALGVSYAFIAEFTAVRSRVRTRAFWGMGRFLDEVEYDLDGTPCRDVLAGALCHHPQGVQQRFPRDQVLTHWGIESYLGVPLYEPDGTVMGHLAVFDERPLPEEPRKMFLFRSFALRVSSELARLKMEERLQQSEERYRDLYEEAPIAYVKEDLESRFISANRAAMRILGITPEQVPGTVGMSFVPDTPEAQKRVKEAFASIGRGTDTSGVVLELRRRDNGQPIWIQWWSKPEPGGQFTRTMFVDITAQVLAEAEKARLLQQNQYLQEEIKSVHNFEEIIGQSPTLVAVLDSVQQVAHTDASVLITGETGTGKELIARAIHSHSRRRDRPLIKINCAALPSGLVESELFGHEKGAFTGAITRRVGRFELAAGGTIFLDEIGEMPLEAQAKLLRVLQEREFERVGSTTPIKADVRIIAATNRDLAKAIKDKLFREDLYYRLNVFPVHLPPLRERKGDVALLARFMINRFVQKVGKPVDSLAAGVMERLEEYSWPGNIRELENILERAVILACGGVLDIPPEVFGAGDAAAAVSTSSLESVEREHIERMLEQAGGVIEGYNGAARLLGLHPNTLRSRMKKLGISRKPLTD
jgi:PAS domain S-box-containing protein